MMKPAGTATSTSLHAPRLSRTISPAASALLDVIRLSAALAVVADHASLQEFNPGARDRQMWGLVAVPIFFVLSGFIIRHVAGTRESDIGEYLVDRASRIYSMVLPALALGLLVGVICHRLDPQVFARSWSATFHSPVQRLVVNLLFLSQAWGMDTTPFLNIPFWSLGYECTYYVLFGCAFFLRGRARVFATIATCVIAGPQVLLLLPTWVLGCVLYDVYQRLRSSVAAKMVSAAATLVTAAAVFGAVLGRSEVLRLPWRMLQQFASLPNPLTLAGFSVKHATMLALGAGLLAAPLMLILLLGVEPLRLRKDSRVISAIRMAGDGTFALYLLHYPLLVLALFLGLLRPGHTSGNVTTVAGICILALAFGPVANRLKRALRRLATPPSSLAASPAQLRPLR